MLIRKLKIIQVLSSIVLILGGISLLTIILIAIFASSMGDHISLTIAWIFVGYFIFYEIISIINGVLIIVTNWENKQLNKKSFKLTLGILTLFPFGAITSTIFYKIAFKTINKKGYTIVNSSDDSNIPKHAHKIDK